ATAYVPVQPAIIVGRHMADTFPPGRPQPVDGGTSRPSYMHGSTSSKQSSSTAAADARSARARACARRLASPHRTRTAPQPLAKAGLHFAEPCIYPTDTQLIKFAPWFLHTTIKSEQAATKIHP
ncbi:MAG: hypothetical protein J3K34DRAFT_397611, partial [Monoraphidium minutum]